MSTDTIHPTRGEVRLALAVVVQRGLVDELLARAAVVLGRELKRLDGAVEEREFSSRGLRRHRWVGPWIDDEETA